MSLIETGNETVAIDRMDEGQQYQFQVSGVWDGATLTLEEWSEDAGDYVPVKVLRAAATFRRFVMGNRARWVATDVGDNTALTGSHMRIKDGLSARTVEDIAAILSGENLFVGGLGLEDRSLETLDYGILALDAQRRLRMHNAIDVGGDFVLPRTEELNIVYAGSHFATKKMTELVRFPVLGSELEVGRRIKIYGRTFINWTSNTLPDTIFFHILPPADFTAWDPDAGASFGFDVTDARTIELTWAAEFDVVASGGGNNTFALVPTAPFSAGYTKTTTAGAMSQNTIPMEDLSFPIFPEGTGLDLVIGLGTTAKASAAGLRAFIDLKLTVE